jgi:hypothetical protein
MADNTQLNAGAGGDVIATDDIGGVKFQRVKATFGVDGVATDVSSANPLPTKSTDGTTTQGFRPDGFTRTAADPTTLLFDTFETLDTTNTWTTGGTAPTAPSGSLIVAAGTSASASSYLASKPSFTPGSNALLQTADLVALQAGVITGAKCVWGLGIVAGAPTAALPLSNGAVFEILDTDGALYGAVYSNSVRTQQLALTRPADGLTHRYAIYYKNSRVYFEIDNVAVGSVSFPNPTVGALKRVIGTFNGLSVLGGAPTLTASLLGLADSGKNSIKIADGQFPWRMQTVKDASIPAAATDLAAVVALSPNSFLPGMAPTVLWVTATAATGVASTLTLAAVAGQFHYVTAIDIQLYATAARTGAATPLLVTTTNLPGSPVWNFPTAQAIGALDRYDVPLLTPLKSSVANTATTFVAPIATTGIWRMNVGYYTGP